MSAVRLKSVVRNLTDKSSGAPAVYYALEHVEPGQGRLAPGAEPGEEERKEAVKCRAGDILFGKLRAYLCKVLAVEQEATCSPELLVLRPESDILAPRFLYYLCLSRPFVEWAVATSDGVKMPRTDWSSLGELRLPSRPALVDQARATDYLDRECARIDELIAEQLTMTRLIEQRRFAEISATLGCRMTGEPGPPTSALGALPEGWTLRPLRGLATIQSGLTLGKSYEGHLTELPYLRVANVHDGRIDTDDVSTVEIPEAVAARHTLAPGDVLLTEGGDNDKLGRGAVWDGQLEPCLHQNHVFAVRPDRTKLSPEWLAMVTASAWGRTYFTSTANQTTNLASTNRAKLGRLPVPLPPVIEQRRILDRIDEVGGRLDELHRECQRQIDLLLEHRSSLIEAVVTGLQEVA